MTRHYPGLGNASDWPVEANFPRSTTNRRVVTRHQYGISALVPWTSFDGETSGNVAKCRLFSSAKKCWEISSNRINVTLVTPGLISFSVLCANSMMRRTGGRKCFIPEPRLLGALTSMCPSQVLLCPFETKLNFSQEQEITYLLYSIKHTF